jgi:predicted ester cyclase
MNGQGLGFWRETITSRAHMTKNKLVTTATFGSGFSRRHVMLAATAAIGLLNARPDAAHSDERNVSDEASMTSAASPRNPVMTRDQLVARLKRAGELEVSGEDQAETDSYFDTVQYRFHGPDGFEADYAGLTNYFKAIRAAFDDRSVRRGIVVAEGNYIACQTWIEGKFVREFTHSPAGPLHPNGQRVVWDLLNIFRFDDQGRLVEEWVRTDYRSFLRQLGAPGK